jgi:ribosomal protein S18 acetylase RimI-like enzyme
MLRLMRANVRTWSLEITDPAELRPSSAPPQPVEIRRAVLPSPELGRFLYTAAGGNWYWTDRLAWSYAEWVQRLTHPRVETWVLYEEGTPVAYFELDGSSDPDVEIAYFGVLPAFIGRRLGGWLLTEAIRRGFAMGSSRIWVHTCTLDSPYALANYQARGMHIFKEQTEVVDLPDETPGPWPGAGVHGAHATTQGGSDA